MRSVDERFPDTQRLRVDHVDVALTAVVADQLLHDLVFVAGPVRCVGLAVQIARGADVAVGPDGNGTEVVLQDGGYAHQIERLGLGAIADDTLGRAQSQIGPPQFDLLGRRNRVIVIGGGHDRDFEAEIAVQPLLLGDEETDVVDVGRPIQRQCELFHSSHGYPLLNSTLPPSGQDAYRSIRAGIQPPLATGKPLLTRSNNIGTFDTPSSGSRSLPTARSVP